MNSLGIAIDGGRYVRVDSRIGELPHNVRLRTLDASQQSAVIDFCRFRRGKADVIRSHRVNGLRSTAGVPSELKLRIERRSYAGWEIRISGAGSKAEVIRLRTGIGLWPIIIPAAVIFGLLVWLLLNFTILNPAGRPPAGNSLTVIESASQEPEALSVNDEQSAGEPSSGDAAASTEPSSGGQPTGGEQTEAEPSDTISADADPSPADQAAGDESAASGEAGTADTASAEEPTTVPTAVPEQSALSGTTELPALPEPLTVYFEPESAVLSGRAKRDLDGLGVQIQEGTEILVEGHSADFGTERGQLALSRLRAVNVADYLASIYPGTFPVTVDGYGVDRPATRNPEQQHLNRRVVITLRETAE